VINDQAQIDILRRVRAIPLGFVATYSDICPDAPRLAGRVLSDSDDPEVPWQRVVRADGSLAKGERQRVLLEAEATPFRGHRVAMEEARIPSEELAELADAA